MINYEEFKRISQRAINKGKIVLPDLVVEEVSKKKPGSKKRIKGPKKQCPECHRFVFTLEDGRILNHRKYEDKRGYGNGEWCSYSEVHSRCGN